MRAALLNALDQNNDIHKFETSQLPFRIIPTDLNSIEYKENFNGMHEKFKFLVKNVNFQNKEKLVCVSLHEVSTTAS